MIFTTNQHGKTPSSSSDRHRFWRDERERTFLSKFFACDDPRLNIVRAPDIFSNVITLRRRRGKPRSFIYFAPDTTKLWMRPLDRSRLRRESTVSSISSISSYNSNYSTFIYNKPIINCETKCTAQVFVYFDIVNISGQPSSITINHTI